MRLSSLFEGRFRFPVSRCYCIMPATLLALAWTLTMFLAQLVSAQQTASGRKSVQPPPNWLTCEVGYSMLADKAQAYVGDGDDLYVQSFSGGMSSIAIVKGDDGVERGYLAGEVKASAGHKVLIVECNFKYSSASQQVFHPLDVEVGDKTGKPVAVGVASSYPFAKDEATWAKLRRKVVWKVDPSANPTATYVFLVSNDVSSWKLMYHQAQIAEIRPEKK